jgi:hypothetical protein
MKHTFMLMLLTVQLLLVTGISPAADWSPWTPLDDGALNGIEFSHRSDCPAKADKSTCPLIWRFRSGYEDPVELEYTLTWNTPKGTKTQTKRFRCLPGENSAAAFTVSGSSLEEVTVRVIASDDRADGWSEWTLLDDGAMNGIEFSHRTDCGKKAKDGACVLRWRFLSRYDDPVEIEYALSWGTAK